MLRPVGCSNVSMLNILSVLNNYLAASVGLAQTLFEPRDGDLPESRGEKASYLPEVLATSVQS
jgi:hypothetical protein